MRTDTTIYRPRVRRRHSARRIALRRGVFLAVVASLLAILVGLAFSGSRTLLAEGTTVAGIDVGGMPEDAAVRLLSQRSEAVQRKPVAFVAGDRRFTLTAARLGVEPDWRGAVAAAAAEGGGFGPVRGFKRLWVRFFGADISPPVDAYDAAVQFKLAQIARAVHRAGVNAALVRKGLRVSVVEGRSGRALDRDATVVVLRSLARFERGGPVELPVVATPPRVSAADLEGAAIKARTALSAPLRLAYGETRWLVPRWRIATLLSLPSGGTTKVSIAGRRAEAYLERLSATVSRPPRDASFQVTATGRIVIRPSAPGLLLDMPATASSIAAAVFTTDRRTADLVVRVAEPKRTTRIAETMGITRVVASYTTTYGGTPGRLNNVQLVAELIDGALIKPGGTFSFNETTGERTAEKGFQEAPVIINGELKNGLGGGVCQVSTTVFNAAFEAGLPINARTNHALYIDHYPLGRDATVNFPDIDLRFSNDTDHWLLLRTFVGAGSLTVNLYGTPVGRRVESSAEPLVETGPVPVKETEDPTLEKGRRIIDEIGSPPRETRVRRLVYDGSGDLLYDDTWKSYYVGEPTLVFVGTKEEPRKKKKPVAVRDKPAASGEPGVTTTPVDPAGSTGVVVTTSSQP